MITNEHLYERFDLFMRKIEFNLEYQKIPFSKVDESILRKRISQKIMQIIFYPYSIVFCKKINTNQKNSLDVQKQILGGIRINKDDHKPTVTPKLFFYSIGLFLGLVILQLKSLTCILFSRKNLQSTKYVLMFDSGSLDLSDINKVSEFEQFCENGPIKLLQNRKIVIISTYNFISKSIKSSKNPLIEVLYDRAITNKEILSLIVQTIYSSFETIIASFRQPLICVIATDFVNLPIVKLINRKELVDGFVITTSSMFSQPLWMRDFPGKRFSTHFINYSNNSVKFIYKKSPIFYHFPALRHICVDVHWVWNENHEKMYRLVGHTGRIHIVGPILFYLRKDEKNNKRSDIRISLFDVTPAVDAVLANLGLPKYYYTIETVTNFVEKVLEVCSLIEKKIDQPIKILLKHKRQFTSGFHSTLYQKNIEMLLDKYQNFQILSHNDNLYDIIGSCVATVSIPYTSTAFISANIGVPAIYFDSTKELLKPSDADQNIKYTYVESELENQLYSIIFKTLESNKMNHL